MTSSPARALAAVPSRSVGWLGFALYTWSNARSKPGDVVMTRAVYCRAARLQLHRGLTFDDVGVGDHEIGPDEEAAAARGPGVDRRHRWERSADDVFDGSDERWPPQCWHVAVAGSADDAAGDRCDQRGRRVPRRCRRLRTPPLAATRSVAPCGRARLRWTERTNTATPTPSAAPRISSMRCRMVRTVLASAATSSVRRRTAAPSAARETRTGSRRRATAHGGRRQGSSRRTDRRPSSSMLDRRYRASRPRIFRYRRSTRRPAADGAFRRRRSGCADTPARSASRRSRAMPAQVDDLRRRREQHARPRARIAAQKSTSSAYMKYRSSIRPTARRPLGGPAGTRR